MSWSVTSEGNTSNKQFAVYSETVALGGTSGATRYSSVIDFVPPGVGFTVISNSGTTNTSGSASDQLYIGFDRNGTFQLRKDTLRDCNYLDDKDQGTSYRSIDNAVRVRYVDPSYVGQFPYYKLAVKHAAVESSSKTITFKVIVGNVDKLSPTAG